MTRNKLTNVDKNLYRDDTGTYWGSTKIRQQHRWKNFHTKVRKEADSILASWKIELTTSSPRGSMKMPELCALYLLTRVALKSYTEDKARTELMKKTFVIGEGKKITLFEAIPVHKVTPADLKVWLANQSVAGKRKWKGRTFNRYRLFIKDLFLCAEAKGVVTEVTNPYKEKFIKSRKRDPVERNIPSEDEFYAIIDSVRSQGMGNRNPLANGGSRNGRAEESADFLAFQGLAALGQEEVKELKWIRIKHDATPMPYMEIMRGKTGEFFTVPIFHWLRPLLDKLMAAREDISPEARVFRIKDAGNSLTAACKRLTMTHFTQRNLRQFGIGLQGHAGISSRQAAFWQGHTDGGVMVQSIYRKVKCSDDAARELAEFEKLGAIPVRPLSTQAQLRANLHVVA